MRTRYVLTFLFFLVAFTLLARADERQLLPKCQSALAACDELTKAQGAENVILKDSLKQYKNALEAEHDTGSHVLVGLVSGCLAGGLGGQLMNGATGLAAGGAAGCLMGLAVGLIGGSR